MPEKRDSKGQFEAEHGVGAEDVFDAMEHLEPYTTGELASELGIPRRTAYHYLENLYESGKIDKKKPEERRAIWIRGK